MSPSLVSSISPSDSLSNLPTGYMRSLYPIKSTMLFFPCLSVVVHTIPTGLLKAMTTCGGVQLSIFLPSTHIIVVSSTISPITAILPSIVIRPSCIILSASRLEQTPWALRYLLIRSDMFPPILIFIADKFKSIYRCINSNKRKKLIQLLRVLI